MRIKTSLIHVQEEALYIPKFVGNEMKFVPRIGDKNSARYTHCWLQITASNLKKKCFKFFKFFSRWYFIHFKYFVLFNARNISFFNSSRAKVPPVAISRRFFGLLFFLLLWLCASFSFPIFSTYFLLLNLFISCPLEPT